MSKNEAEFARAALRAHVATELGESAESPAVLAEVALRLKLAKTSPEQARANRIVIEAARMQDEAGLTSEQTTVPNRHLRIMSWARCGNTGRVLACVALVSDSTDNGYESTDARESTRDDLRQALETLGIS